MPTTPERPDGWREKAERLVDVDPSRAIACALVSIANDVRMIRHDLTDIRRQSARKG